MEAYQGSSQESGSQGGWKRYQPGLASQIMIFENCFFLEKFVGLVILYHSQYLISNSGLMLVLILVAFFWNYPLP